MSRHRIAYVLIVLAFLGINVAPVHAKSQLAIGQQVYEKMQQAQVLLEEKNYDGAKAKLMEILEEKKLNNFEIAQTWSLHGNVNFHMERFDLALQDFEKVLTFDDLPPGFLQLSLRTAAQLAFMQDEYDRALKHANRLLTVVESQDGEIYMLLSQIYYKKEEMQPALKNSLKAIEIERGLGKTIKENWLLVLNAIYYNLEDYSSMEGVLKELIQVYPKDMYVKNLAAVYGQTDRTKEQLLLMEPLYEKGYLKTESELVNLAQLMNVHQVPYKAAVIMEKAFKEEKVERNRRNLELTSQSWQVAAEGDLAAKYLAEAAAMGKDANTFVRLAQIYMNMYKWKEAEGALEKALKYGDLDREGNAHLLLGMVRFYQNNYREAKKAFREAEEFDDAAKLADQWIAYVDQEQAKQDAANAVN